MVIYYQKIQQKNITINIKFKDDITEADLPTESQTINLSYQITYTQYDGGNMEVEPDGSEDENLPRYVLDDGWFNRIDTFYEDEVESISFLRNIDVPETAEDTVVDVSQDKDNSVLCWYEDSDSNDLYELYFGANGIIAAPEKSYELFAYMEELKKFKSNRNFDTSNVTDMRYMFKDCSSLTSLDLSEWDTSNTTKMSSMFRNCSSLTSLDLSNFNTSNVTNMAYMFYRCVSLISLDLSNFDTSKVTNMPSMFSGSLNDSMKLENINLTGWDTSSVEDMSDMFKYCSSLTSLDLSSFNTSNDTNMDSMFSSCSSLTELKFNSAEINGVPWTTGKDGPFDGTTNLTVYVKNETVKNLFEQKAYSSIDTPGLKFVVQPLNS